MDDAVVYRAATATDEPAIIRFLRECGYDHDGASWRWIHRQCPHGATLTEIGTVGDRVVGHYAVLPRSMRIDGRPVQAGLAIHAAVHPELRGLALFHGLFARIVARCTDAGLPFMYGFPNDRVWLVYLKVLRWRAIDDLVALELPLREVTTAALGADVRLAGDFDDARYAGWDDGEVLGGMTHVVRDAAYLRWRYRDHPRVDYRVLEACDNAGRALAFVVLKLHARANTRYGHIVDIGARGGAEAAVEPLIRAALADFRSGGAVDVASCWMPDGTMFRQTLDRLGFRPTGFTTHLGYRQFGADIDEKSFGRERWHVTMGDSDAF